MATDPVVRKLCALLASDAHERQIAAAIVLGEIGARDAPVVQALLGVVGQGLPPVQRHALEALGRLRAPKALPVILQHVGARDEGVRAAAVGAAVAFGHDAVAPVRARLAAAHDAAELRGLEEILGRVGGKDAFTTLLAALDTTDVAAARSAALAARQRIKEATPRERKSYLGLVTKSLSGGKRHVPSEALRAASLKILGYLEDPAALPTLLTFAKNARQSEAVREEALIALRFVTSPAAVGRVAVTLLDVAESGALPLARTALYTLASLAVPASLARRLGRLALEGEAERAELAIERLGQMPGSEAATELGTILAKTGTKTGTKIGTKTGTKTGETGDRRRAEAAATALATRPDAARALGSVLLQVAGNDERVQLLTRLLAPHVAALSSGGAPERKLARGLIDAALARGADSGPGAQSLLDLARRIDGPATAAGMRALGARLRKAGKPEALQVLRRLGHSADASPEDGYALASAELTAGRRDEALTILRQLIEGGFDVAAALRRDRALNPERRYHIGFQLLEQRLPAGEEILQDLARDGGRGKVARMAKAKLKSAGVV